MIHTDGIPTIANGAGDDLFKVVAEKVYDAETDTLKAERRVAVYEWEITYRHGVQGFGRSVKADGVTLGEALESGIELLKVLGYDDKQVAGFEPTNIERKRIITYVYRS